MPKLYTKVGDNGTTSLCDMKNVSKADWVFKVLGDFDELSAQIGLLCVFLNKNENGERVKHLRKIQSKLLDLGSNFATMYNRDRIVHISGEDVKELENQIDYFDSQSPKLTEFILPGAGESDSVAHICRAVCRRAERNMWTLTEIEDNTPVEKEAFHYVNRLSDYFFALARFLVYSTGLKEITRSESKRD